MDKYFRWKVFLIIAVVVGSVWAAYPPSQKINLGLDLQGGMQMLLEVQIDRVPAENREDATERVVEIIRNRIDEFGVREPIITKQGKNSVMVQLPGVTDRDRAKEIIAKTAHLEFQLVSDDPDIQKQAEEGKVPEDFVLSPYKDQMGMRNILLKKDAALTGDHLTNASVGFDQYGQPIVQLQLDKVGADVFDKVTLKNVGKQLAIVLDGKVYSAPVIRDRIPNGQAQISGNFTAREASDLALVLRAGALPAPVQIVEERTVGPTLGRDSIESGLRAAFLGTLLVFVFMPLYYLLSGAIADVGLIVYVLMIFGTMALSHQSLTLPGIAGFILSVGMAVDANILISERIREELQTGKSPRAAVSAGYNRAFDAIFDSNATVFITSVILFFMGTGPIKGFAVTLGLGQIASMFSALTVTRVIFDFILKQKANLKLNMRRWIGITDIRFLKGRYFGYGFSLITIILGIIVFSLRGQGNFGVEFMGGTMVQIEFQKPVKIEALREALDKKLIAEPSIQFYGDTSHNQFMIKSLEADTKKIEEVATALAGKDFQILRVDQVGPAVSQDLKKKALWAVFWAALGILVYLGVRFKWNFSLAAVIGMLHDCLFTFSLYALTGREITLSTVAAILTILGYSVNDTIITFDRVRENLKSTIYRKKTFSEIVDLSINQTLGRTILTSSNVLFGALALFFLGGSGINDFAFTLCIGFAVGIYSTVFVSSALLVDWKKHR